MYLCIRQQAAEQGVESESVFSSALVPVSVDVFKKYRICIYQNNRFG